MSKQDDIQKILDEWKHEYGVSDYRITFMGWHELKADNPKSVRLGQCNYYLKSYLSSSVYAEIRLGIGFKDRRLGWLEKSVLWHEFCHACAFIEDERDDAHNDHWRDLRRRKWWYVLGEYIADFTYSLMINVRKG